eukprot:1392184-Amorphochlora_amoeboformis.AAC.2
MAACRLSPSNRRLYRNFKPSCTCTHVQLGLLTYGPSYGRRVPPCAIRVNPVSAESCTSCHFHGSKFSPIPAAFSGQSVAAFIGEYDSSIPGLGSNE